MKYLVIVGNRAVSAYSWPMPATTPTPLRLVLVDDHEMVLHGLVAMLGHFVDQVVVTGQATTADVLTLMAAGLGTLGMIKRRRRV